MGPGHQVGGDGPAKVTQQSEVPRDKWGKCWKAVPSSARAMDGWDMRRNPTEQQVAQCGLQ